MSLSIYEEEVKKTNNALTVVEKKMLVFEEVVSTYSSLV